MPNLVKPVSGSLLAAGSRRVAQDLLGLLATVGPLCATEYAMSVLLELRNLASERNFDSVDRRMARRSRTFRFDGLTLDFAGSQFHVAREILARRVYFPDARFKIAKGDVVVDLGANEGVFTALAAALGASVLAVEAISELADSIREQCSRRGLAQRVTVINAIIGGDKGLFAATDELAYGPYRGVRPAATSMPDLLEQHGLSHVDFLKIDIEGSEFSLFQGACGWLERIRVVAMEVHAHFGDPRVILELLSSSGFAVQMHDMVGRPVIQLKDHRGLVYAIRPDGVPQDCARRIRREEAC